MIRPLALASLIAFAVLPSLPGAMLTARADGFAESAPRTRGPHPRAVRHVPARPWAPAPRGVAPAPMPEADLVHGWLPRNLNLPIYNAPSDGPTPTL